MTHAIKGSGGKYRWRANDFRPRPGRFYARVSSTPACQADNSKTLRISPRPDTKITDLAVRSGRREAIVEYKGIDGVRPYTYRCKLDDRRYRRLRFGKHTYKHLKPGHHLFKVYSVADNGKRDLTPAKVRFHIHRRNVT